MGNEWLDRWEADQDARREAFEARRRLAMDEEQAVLHTAWVQGGWSTFSWKAWFALLDRLQDEPGETDQSGDGEPEHPDEGPGRDAHEEPDDRHDEGRKEEQVGQRVVAVDDTGVGDEEHHGARLTT